MIPHRENADARQRSSSSQHEGFQEMLREASGSHRQLVAGGPVSDGTTGLSDRVLPVQSHSAPYHGAPIVQRLRTRAEQAPPPPVAPSRSSARTSARSSLVSTTSATSLPVAVGPTATTSASAAGRPPKKKRIRIMTDRRREQCRQNQTRYRHKQKQSSTQLEMSVDQLRHQVRMLQEQKRVLYYTVHMRDAASRMIVEYVALFTHGLAKAEQPRSSLSSVVSSVRNHGRYPDRPTLDQQMAFIESSFDHCVRIGDELGRGSLVEQARRFATFYDGFILDLDRLESLEISGNCTTITAGLYMGATNSSATFQHVFPHLLHSKYYHLRRKLLGQRLVCRAFAVFVIGNNGQISQMDWTVEFVGGFHQILTIEETAIVLKQARIVRDAYLVEDCEPAHHHHRAEEKEKEEKRSEATDQRHRPNTRIHTPHRHHQQQQQQENDAFRHQRDMHMRGDDRGHGQHHHQHDQVAVVPSWSRLNPHRTMAAYPEKSTYDHQEEEEDDDDNDEDDDDDNDEDGKAVYIHDGQGDDFVMV